MGWCGGSELAADVWAAIRNLLPAGDARTIAARKIIYYFEQRDCDTMVEASELCEDAGWVYDESVYTPLLDSRVGCDLGVPCRDCPKFAFRARRPPTSTVISGAVSVNRLARSNRRSACDPSSALAR